MQPHWVEALRIELRRSEYVGLSADDAYRLVTERPQQISSDARLQINTQTEAEKRLTRTRFIESAKWNSMRNKDRERMLDAGVVVAVDASDVPGFPNKVRRDLFDAAWGSK